MVRLNSTGVRLAATLTALSLALVVGWFIVKPLFASMALSEPPTMSELSRALSYDKRNPSHHYHRALHHYYDLSARDVNLALTSYLKAISLNPVSAMYWLGLAKTYESKGDLKAASLALERALDLNPTYAKSRWMAVNLMLKEGGGRPVQELGRIIKDFPTERKRAFSILHRITNDDVPFILEEAIPKELSLMAGYLDFLISRDDARGVDILWSAISERFQTDESLRVKYINYLVSADQIPKARRYWSKDVGGGKAEAESRNLILNSGFEDDICKNRLCWAIAAAKGVEAGIDDKLSYQGARSLRIEFDGTANVNFHHVSMIVPLEPGKTYTLSAFIKTEGLTTTNGFFIEFYGRGDCKFSARTKALTGSNPWRELNVEVKAPAGCRAGVVRLRRLKSEKFDNLIKGQVWLDGVSLVESNATKAEGGL